MYFRDPITFFLKVSIFLCAWATVLQPTQANPAFSQCILVTNAIEGVDNLDDPQKAKAALDNYFSGPEMSKEHVPDFPFWKNLVQIDITENGKFLTHGSGVYIGKRDSRHFVITARHVIDEGTAHIKFSDEISIPAKTRFIRSSGIQIGNIQLIGSSTDFSIVEISPSREQEKFLSTLPQVPIIENSAAEGTKLLTLGAGHYDRKAPLRFGSKVRAKRNAKTRQSWAFGSVDSRIGLLNTSDGPMDNIGLDYLKSEPCRGLVLPGDSGGPRFWINPELKRWELAGVSVSIDPHNINWTGFVAKFGESSAQFTDASIAHEFFSLILNPPTINESELPSSEKPTEKSPEISTELPHANNPPSESKR